MLFIESVLLTTDEHLNLLIDRQKILLSKQTVN